MRSNGDIRVLVLTNMYPTAAEPHLGCFVRDQVEDLRALGAGVEVQVFDGRQDKRQYLRAAGTLRRALRRGRFDLVHAHYGLSGAVAAAQMRTPVVTTFHGSDAWVRRERWVSRAVARRTQPIAVAPVVAEALGLDGMAPVIPCGVDLDRFRPGDPAEARRELGWPEDGPCILFPAARGDRSKAANKRVDVFDATVARVRRSIPEAHAASLDDLPRHEVALAMRAADVAVMTSVREGAPVAVKEALASGTPVVSVAVGDVPDLIRGLPGCAIGARDPDTLAAAVQGALRAGGDPRLREAMRAYGRRPIAERVLAVYRRLLAGRAR
jgi:glycosyltransferase involved in cell wall biosynthesis